MAVPNASAFSLTHLLPSNTSHMNRLGICCSISSSSSPCASVGNVFGISKAGSLLCSGINTIAMMHNSGSCSIHHNPCLRSPLEKGTWFQQPKALARQGSHKLILTPCKAEGEDSEGTGSGDSIVVDEQTLEQELQKAIREENYAQAAKIRDSLRVLHEDGKASVLAANARFYTSFRNGDLVAMQALWAKGEHVCCVHPGVSGILGYDLIMGSWEFVWADYDFPLQIELKDIQVHVRGDLGYVNCVEFVKTKGSSWGKQFATNVFERIDGQWFMSIHHASHVDL